LNTLCNVCAIDNIICETPLPDTIKQLLPLWFKQNLLYYTSVAPKNLYHKIDLSPNPFFERRRAYLKSWSIFPSLSLHTSKRTAHCRKKLHDNKTRWKPFCLLLCKTTSGKQENVSHKRNNIRQTKPADACKLNKGDTFPPNYIYPHKAYSKHMFVFIILFYHKNQ
jgi:hypothetical protein